MMYSLPSAIRAVNKWKLHRTGSRFDFNGAWYKHWIPEIPMTVERTLDRIMREPIVTKRLQVQPSLALWSVQGFLVRDTLLYMLRNFSKLNRKNRKDGVPVVVKAFNRWVVWDGNHRATAASLLGQPFWADVFDLDARLDRRRGKN